VLPRIAVFAACVSYWISADKKEALVNASQLSLAFGILSLIAAAAAADGIVFVQDGTPKASIVVPEAASPTERFAADEIQRYIEKMSGAKLPIVSGEVASGGPLISVGKTKLAATRGNGRSVLGRHRARDGQGMILRRIAENQNGNFNTLFKENSHENAKNKCPRDRRGCRDFADLVGSRQAAWTGRRIPSRRLPGPAGRAHSFVVHFGSQSDQ